MSVTAPRGSIPVSSVLVSENRDNENKVLNFTKKYFSCTTVWLTLLAAGLCVFTPLAFHYALPIEAIFTINSVALASMATIGIIYKKEISYEIGLLEVLMRNKFQPKKWAWYSQVDDHIILGAFPLKNKGHMRELRNLAKEKKGLAVLSVVERWEMEKETPFSSPVKPQDWKRNGVQQCIIEAEDHVPLSLKALEKAVRFIHEQVKMDKMVYIHCKAGKARSATALACYYMFKNNFNPQQAIEFVEKKRQIVALRKKSKQARLEEFHAITCPKLKRQLLPQLSFFGMLYGFFKFLRKTLS